MLCLASLSDQEERNLWVSAMLMQVLKIRGCRQNKRDEEERIEREREREREKERERERDCFLTNSVNLGEAIKRHENIYNEDSYVVYVMFNCRFLIAILHRFYYQFIIIMLFHFEIQRFFEKFLKFLIKNTKCNIA